MGTGKHKILLVWPIFQALYPRPFENFAQILIRAGRLPSAFFGVKVYERVSLVTAMTDAAELMLAQGYDAMMVFDDDCFAPVEVVERLIARCFDEGHPFVAAAGIMRGYPFTTTAARYHPEGVTLQPSIAQGAQRDLSGFAWVDDLPNDLADVDFCGVPVAIMRRDLFETIEKPWFGDADEHGQRMTHDAFFCRKAKAAGFAVKVDGTLRCGHLTDGVVMDFDQRAKARAWHGTIAGEAAHG